MIQEGRKKKGGKTAQKLQAAYVYFPSTMLKLHRLSVADSNRRDRVELLLKLVEFAKVHFSRKA